MCKTRLPLTTFFRLLPGLQLLALCACSALAAYAQPVVAVRGGTGTETGFSLSPRLGF